MKKRHLVIALSPTSAGRAIIAAAIAHDLVRLGDDVAFLVHETLSSLLASEVFRCQAVPVHMLPLIGMYLEQVVAEFAPASIILGDYFSNANVLDAWGVAPARLLFRNVPTFTLDVWNCAETGFEADVFQGGVRQMGPGPIQQRLEHFAAMHKLQPVPIVAAARGSATFCSLPPANCTEIAERRSVRHAVGLNESSRAVLFCTAHWQHGQYPESPAARQLAQTVPQLLAEYVARLGQQVHLVHVGPRAFAVQEILQGRYHWRPALPPQEFDQLLSEVDLLVTANISATTISKAMVNQVPVMVLQNRVLAFTREEAEAQMKEPASPALGAWLERSVPLFPFALWPLGYHRFVAPLLEDNPYMKAVEVVEMLDERRVEGTLHGLLFDRTARAEQAHRQAAYLSHVRSLPSGAQLVKAKVGG
jgi:Family of unknown function (DUF6365)